MRRHDSDVPGTIPSELRIAVTGHLCLDDPVAVANRVDSAIDHLIDLLPAEARQDLQLVAVSSLAEGADRVVAEAVRQRDGRLEVILPMDKHEYVREFLAEPSREEFERFWESASFTRTLDCKQTRQASYEQAGRFVVDRADVTIAIWDGEHEQGQEWIPAIVKYVRRLGRPLVTLPTDGRQRIIENLDDQAHAWPGALTSEDFEALRDFNTARVPREPKEKRHTRGGEPAPAWTLPEKGWTVPVEQFRDWVTPYLGRSDALATKYRNQYMRAARVVFTLAALAVTTVAYQIVWFGEEKEWIVGFEVAFLLAILVVLLWGRRRHIHHRWISTRYLAERLRGAYYLALAGAEKAPHSAAMLPNEDPGPPWTRRAFDLVWLDRPESLVKEEDVGPLQRYLAEAWIDHQRQYLANTARRSGRWHRSMTWTVTVLFGLSVVVATLHVSTLDLGTGGKLISIMSVSIPAWAAAVAGANAQAEHLRHSVRCQRMAGLLADAHRRMLATDSLTGVREVAILADGLLRQERGDWFGVVSVKDLEIPA